MLTWLKCFFLGHKWHYLTSSVERKYKYNNDRYPEYVFTWFAFKCDRCQRLKQKKIWGDFSNIPADDLIETR